MSVNEQEDPYLAVARRFFNEFIELKLRIDTGEMDPRKHEKEIAKWKRANQELRASAEYMSSRITELETALARVEDELTNTRRRLNEMILAGGKLVEDMDGKYPLEELMSERAYKAWRAMLQEIPHYGH